MVKLIEFKNWHLDCYSRSIKDFINSLRANILWQIRRCKNNKNYINHQLLLSELEKNLDSDDFLRSYFDNNRDPDILSQRKILINEFYQNNPLLGYFKGFILKYNFNSFDFDRPLIESDDFFSEKEKLIKSNNKKQRFDAILLEKNWNIKIYLETMSKKDSGFICFFITYLDANESMIYEQLQNYSKFIVENIDDSNLLEFNKKNFFYIKITRNINMKENIDFMKEVEISENIVKHLNDELIKCIIASDHFPKFLRSFIPFKK